MKDPVLSADYMIDLESDAAVFKRAVRDASFSADLCLDGMRMVNAAVAKTPVPFDRMQLLIAQGYTLPRAKQLLDARPEGYTETEIDRAKYLSAKYRRLARTL